MALPRNSSFGAFLRHALRNFVTVLSLISEPIRKRQRARILASSASRGVGWDQDDAPPLLVLMIYRARNAQLVRAFLGQLPPNADVRLWALDVVVPELASQTLGCGSGVRFLHLNSLYATKPVAQNSWVVLADDDVIFGKGNLSTAIKVMRRAGLALAQPGQSIAGWWTDLFSVARPFLVARDTNCVEQGPLVIADPIAAQVILPLPKDDDMGWGIEAEWFRLKEGRFRSGIIDECRVVHYGKVADSYPAGREMERMYERLERAGVDTIWQLRSTNGRWWKWQQTPPWGAPGSAPSDVAKR